MIELLLDDATELLLIDDARLLLAEETELDENVIQIKHDAQKINIAQHLFDFIGLAIPMKKLHPRFEQEDADQVTDADENILIYSSSTAPADEDDDDDEPADPRFAALKKIK